jgi:hypothetical protein
VVVGGVVVVGVVVVAAATVSTTVAIVGGAEVEVAVELVSLQPVASRNRMAAAHVGLIAKR